MGYTRGCPSAQKNELGCGRVGTWSKHRRCKTTVVSNLRMSGRLSFICTLEIFTRLALSGR